MEEEAASSMWITHKVSSVHTLLAWGGGAPGAKDSISPEAFSRPDSSVMGESVQVLTHRPKWDHSEMLGAPK